MAIDLAKLVVSMEANTAQFQKDMDRVNGRLDQFARNSKRTADSVSATFRNLRVAATVTAFAAFVRTAANNVSQQKALAESVGLTVNQFSALNFAARQNQLSQEDLGKAIFKINTQLADAASGSDKAAAALKPFGIAVEDIRSGAVGTDEALRKIADKFNQMPNGVNKSALAAELLGDKLASRLIPFLNLGSKSLDEFARKGEETGAVITDKVADAVAKANDKLAALSQTIQTQVLVGLAALFGAVEANDGDKKLEALSGEIEQLEFALRNLDAQAAAAAGGSFLQFLKESFGTDNDYAARIERVTQRLAALRAEREKLKGEQEARIIAGGEKPARAPVDLLPKVDKEADAALKQIERALETEREAVERVYLERRKFIEMNVADEEKRTLLVDKIYRQYIEGMTQATEKELALLEEAQKKTSVFADQAARNIQSFTASLVDAALAGDDLGDTVVAALRRIAAELITMSLLQSLGGSLSGMGGFWGSVGKLLTGARAGGGPVRGGGAYLVGEKGPEIFTPNVSGSIIPNDAMGGGSNSVTVNVDARGADAQAAANFIRGSQALAMQIESSIAEKLARGQMRVAQ